MNHHHYYDEFNYDKPEANFIHSHIRNVESIPVKRAHHACTY